MDQSARLSGRGNGGNGGETPEFKKLLDMTGTGFVFMTFGKVELKGKS